MEQEEKYKIITKQEVEKQEILEGEEKGQFLEVFKNVDYVRETTDIKKDDKIAQLQISLELYEREFNSLQKMISDIKSELALFGVEVLRKEEIDQLTVK